MSQARTSFTGKFLTQKELSKQINNSKGVHITELHDHIGEHVRVVGRVNHQGSLLASPFGQHNGVIVDLRHLTALFVVSLVRSWYMYPRMWIFRFLYGSGSSTSLSARPLLR